MHTPTHRPSRRDAGVRGAGSPWRGRTRLARTATASLALLAGIGCSDQDPVSPAVPEIPTPSEPVAATGRWLVSLRDTTAVDRETLIRLAPERLRSAMQRAADRLDEPVGEAAESEARMSRAAMVAEDEGVEVFQHVMMGFAAPLTAADVERLRADPAVAMVGPEIEVQPSVLVQAPWQGPGEGLEMGGDLPLAAMSQTNAPWGVDRLDQVSRPLDKTYRWNSGTAGAGKGVTIYVIDSGIRPDHVEFGGRATAWADVWSSPNGGIDCMFHGTAVSSNAAGATVGIAREARVRSIRVFGCSGGSTSGIIVRALELVVAERKRYPSQRMVVNMSIGMGRDYFMETALRRAIEANVPVVVSAGNDKADACNTSPGQVPGVIIVGATDSGDRMSGFSNRGSCVDLFAPGSSIKGAHRSSATAYGTWSGTSMSAPFVAGVAALHLGRFGLMSPHRLQSSVVTAATKGKLTSLTTGSPNVLAYAPPPSSLVPQPSSIDSLMLMNADTDKPVPGFERLDDVEYIDLHRLPTRNLNIRSWIHYTSKVTFELSPNGPNRTDTGSPFTLAGDTKRSDGTHDYHAWTPAVGTHTLKVTTRNSAGTIGEVRTIRLVVTDSRPTEPPPPPPGDRSGFMSSPGVASMCVEAQAATSTAPGGIVLASCRETQGDGGMIPVLEQRWRAPAAGTATTRSQGVLSVALPGGMTATSMCLAAVGGSGSTIGGTATLQLVPCDTRDQTLVSAMQWVSTESGGLRNAITGLCLTAPDRSNPNWLTACASGSSALLTQMWNVGAKPR